MESAVENKIKFIANFSHRDFAHAEGIPHIWVNVSYKGDKMPNGSWQHRVLSAFRSKVELLSLGGDVLGLCVRGKHKTCGSLAAFLAVIHQPSGAFCGCLKMHCCASCVSTRVD